MFIVLLDKDTNRLLGSDGIMRIDGRLSLDAVKECVRERNDRFAKNFPHKVAYGFIYSRLFCTPRTITL